MLLPEESDRHPPAVADIERDEREYQRARRTRLLLSVGLVVLFVLLLTVLAFVARIVTPVGRPDADELPEGLTWVRSIYAWGNTEDTQLYGPSDVGIGPDGTIWVADASRFQIVGFTPTGTFKATLSQGPGALFPQSFDVAENGDLYVCDFANDRIVVLAPDNRLVREWKVQLPMEIAVRGDRVVVGSRAGVAVYDRQGNVISYWGQRGSGTDEFDVVRGIAIGPDGTIYLSDTQNRRLKAYSEKGELKWVYPSPEEMERLRRPASPDDTETAKLPFQIPTGMTFDAAGRLLVVDPFEFAIMSIDTETGRVLERWGEFGERDGFFAYPTSIDYDPARDWFAIADTANNRVQIVRLPGSGGGVAEAVRRAWGGPMWACYGPLILLLAAVVIAVTNRRRSRRAEEVAEVSPAG
jgi:sugar lactone lactonase YvrE